MQSFPALDIDVAVCVGQVLHATQGPEGGQACQY